jgi:leucyl-tRNA synthetase
MKLVNQGMILGEQQFYKFLKPDGTYVTWREAGIARVGPDTWVKLSRPPGVYTQPPGVVVAPGEPFEVLRSATAVEVLASDVERTGNRYVLKNDEDSYVEARAYKMSKSRGNVVNPDEVVAEYGADSLRLFEMFMGPLEAVKPWSMEGVKGVRGFLERAWRMIVDDRAEAVCLNAAVQDVEPTAEQNRVLHKTIHAVTRDVEQMGFNTAIARMMEFVNYFSKADPRPKQAMEKFVLIVSPFAPHVAEELWQALGHAETLAYEPWPEYDESLLKEDVIELPVQVNGKLRAVVQVPAGADRAAMETAARQHPKIAELLAGRSIRKVIVVPGRMVNFVVK